ncbi:MAG TPA: sodium:proton antiporter [Microbacterium sp.]|uniref:cation:proton antiporter n=1 Tax=Microbacterium sp. TaxID=51671 RepID=UPI002C85EF06|nr:sodium:proton antiporter [Microbacterium sp.]HWI31405.1 sodium:proton antiporter [Microbacterium sp.]
MNSEIFYVLVGAVAVAAVARWRGWPAPLLVTVVALAVSYIPGVPELEIDGELLLNLVLPPLLYSAALDVSFVNFRQSLPQIRRLGIWLVVITTAAVGAVAFLIMPSLTLPGALLLGAIVAPPDAVSAASIGRRLGLPRRIMTVISGESLINDATSLTLFRVFAAIVAGATVTVLGGVWDFLVAVAVGVAVGLLFGVLLNLVRLRLSDPVAIGTFGLLVPFGAYAIAEHLGGSGVLAVVAMGLYVGYQAPRTSYTTRQQERPVWLSVDLLLESFVFAYIGLQLPDVIGELAAGSESVIVQTIWLSVAALGVVLFVRPIFVFAGYSWGQWRQRHRLARWRDGLARRSASPLASGRRARIPTEAQMRMRMEPVLSRRDRVIVSWAGMRGVVTLASAAAVADIVQGGLPDTALRAIVFVAFVVTVGTLLLQGLTLPLLIKSLGVAAADEKAEDARELAEVRARTHLEGRAYLTAKRAEWETRFGSGFADRFDRMARSLTRFESDAEKVQAAEEASGEGVAGAGGAGAGGAGAAAAGGEALPRPTFEDFAELSRGWLEVRRRVLIEHRDAGTLNEEVMRELIVAMDAEELALDTRGDLRGRTP